MLTNSNIRHQEWLVHDINAVQYDAVRIAASTDWITLQNINASYLF